MAKHDAISGPHTTIVAPVITSSAPQHPTSNTNQGDKTEQGVAQQPGTSSQSGPGTAADVEKHASQPPAATAQQTAPVPAKKTISAKEIMNDLEEWNKKLDSIERAFNIPRPSEQNPDAILANVYIDSLISFETKVMYLTNYFEAKHIEILAAKK